MRSLIALVVLLSSTNSSFGVIVSPTSYSALNGESATFGYWDGSYNGLGQPFVDLSGLSGGLGDLTDGVEPSLNYPFVENRQGTGPYVGWYTVDPIINFCFPTNQRFQSVRVLVDDSNNQGGVNPPGSVRLSDGIHELTQSVIDPADGSPFWVNLDASGLAGLRLTMEVVRRTPVLSPSNPANDSWIMLGEVEFDVMEPLQGDTDNDFSVGVADLNSVRNHFGEGILGGPRISGDAYPYDGIVNIVDLSLVRNSFGTSVQSVPEPASMLTALAALIATLLLCKRL